MILQVGTYKTRSGSTKLHGRNDYIKLLPENEEEKKRITERRKAGFPVEHHGSGNWWRAIEDLREAARAIDPHFKEDQREFTV